MDIHARPVESTTLLYPPGRLSERAGRLPWVVGRETRTGRIEVGAGAALVVAAERTGKAVDCLLLPLDDKELRELARLDDADGRLQADVAGMQILVRHGLKVAEAGRALGIAARADAQKLHRLAELHPKVLAACQERGLTANHARWLLGVEPGEALARVMGKEERPSSGRKRGEPPTVAELKALRARGRKSPESRRANSDTDATLAHEATRISEVLAAPVELAWGPDGGELRLGFADVESLVGMLERLGRFGVEPPGPAGGRRFVTLPLVTFDELAYLVGTADDR